MMLASDGLTSPAGIVALTGLVAAIGAIVGAILAAIPTMRRSKDVQATVNSTHAIVNGERTATLAYQGVLQDALTAAGATVPATPTGVVVPAPLPTQESLTGATSPADGGQVG